MFLDISSRVLRSNQSISVIPHSGGLKNCSYPRVAIFAGYLNTKSEIVEAERILKLLRREFDLLILVNTGSIELNTNNPHFLYLQRENFGRDLASYKHVLNSLELKNTSELFLFNDSVLWTEDSILDFLANARKSNYEVTALTSSDQHSYHLQSYALHMKGDISEISKAFGVIRISNLKRVIVEAGEKRLSNYWIAKKIRIGSIYTQDSLSPLLGKYKDTYGHDYEHILDLISQGVPLNPSIHFWVPLYAQSGVIKKALLNKNPAQLKYVPKTLLDLQAKIALDSKLG